MRVEFYPFTYKSDITSSFSNILVTHELQHDIAVLFMRVRIFIPSTAMLIGPLYGHVTSSLPIIEHLVLRPTLEIFLWNRN